MLHQFMLLEEHLLLCMLKMEEIYLLQQLLGHSKLETTRKYVNLSLRALKENYEQYNPLDTFIKANRKEKIKMGE